MPLSAEEYDNWYYTEKGKYIGGLEKEVLLNMIKPSAISRQLSAIDIGCGTGYFTRFLSAVCRNVVGIDRARDMIKYAKKKTEDRGQRTEVRIKYLVADAENLPFKDRSFDISVSITAVNFFKNPAGAIPEAVRVSKKRIFLGVLNKWSLLSVLKKLKGFFSKTTYSDACFYSQREIVNILSAFPQIKRIYKQHTYFLPFPRIRLILSGFERIIPSWLPFGGFMGIVGYK